MMIYAHLLLHFKQFTSILWICYKPCNLLHCYILNDEDDGELDNKLVKGDMNCELISTKILHLKAED